jgi:hypothetical protein
MAAHSGFGSPGISSVKQWGELLEAHLIRVSRPDVFGDDLPKTVVSDALLEESLAHLERRGIRILSAIITAARSGYELTGGELRLLEQCGIGLLRRTRQRTA